MVQDNMVEVFPMSMWAMTFEAALLNYSQKLPIYKARPKSPLWAEQVIIKIIGAPLFQRELPPLPG